MSRLSEMKSFNTVFHSVIKESSLLKPDGGKHKRETNAELLLTALIDAFSILVIFLLMSFSSTGDLLFLSKGMELPKAELAVQLDRNPLVKFDQGKIYIEDLEVKSDGLVEALLDLRKKHLEMRPDDEFPGILTVQADRRAKYQEITQIVQASAHAGFSEIKFAVVMK